MPEVPLIVTDKAAAHVAKLALHHAVERDINEGPFTTPASKMVR